ncbi:cell division protein FtsK [Campylobacter sp. MIT 99-7217]|nr:DNA translocase FtsK [Campylobacter sp. MIT 99-7217]TQR31837.1 cell division protein FtsK [Campylobacter sp. MIT 99-7217]
MPESVGFLGTWFFKFNEFVFGDFGSYYPFALFALNFLYYKRGFKIEKIARREYLGIGLSCLSSMILFAILGKNAGYLPEFFYMIFGAIFGRVGSGLISLALLLFSIVLLFPNFIYEVFRIKVDFASFLQFENMIKNKIYSFFGGEKVSTEELTTKIPSPTIKEDELLQEKENSQVAQEQNIKKESDEEIPFQKPKEEKNHALNEEIKETKKEEEKPSQKDDFFQEFIRKASKDLEAQKEAERKELEQRAAADIIPPRFLKPKNIDEIKLELSRKENFDEPSYKRANINLHQNEDIKEQETNLNQDNFEIHELHIENTEKEQDFIPIVEELDKINYTPKTIKLQDLQAEFQKKPKPQNIDHEDIKAPKHSIIQKELSSNKALLDDIEKGELEKPKDFSLPPLDFLLRPSENRAEIDEQEIDKKIYDLLEKLRRFKIGGDVISTYTGPVVTTFEFRPSADVKVSRILNLQDDLAMALRAKSIRIQAPIPGKDVVGIEVPNEQIQTIYLREILESDSFKKAKSPLTIALGKDIVGNAFVSDLKKLPHLLIAGTTGSGKSVGINAMLLSLLYRNSPKNLRLMMIDPKMLEFSIYNEIPHLLTPVITEAKKAITALSNMVAEMERRYKLMAEAKTKNIENYNEKMKEQGLEQMPFIVVIIDELADLMMTAGKDVEFYIGRLAQMARASGIHLIVATQRPSVDVVTGLIKANLPSRLAYKVGQKIDSKVILDTMGAESLLGRGDCLFTPPGTSNLVRLHAPFASELEIEKIVEFLKAQQGVNYDESFLKDESPASNLSLSSSEDSNLGELFEEAKAVILADRKTSISYLQRRLKIGYNRAANIIEELSNQGFLSQPDSKGQREILQK